MNHDRKFNSQRYRPRYLRPLPSMQFMGLLLAMIAQVQSAIVVTESPLFYLDTRNLRVVTIAESSLFTINTMQSKVGFLAGEVVSRGSPVASAIVELSPSGMMTSVNSMGVFGFTGVTVGSGYVLKASAPGYASKWIQEIRIREGVGTLVTVELQPSSGNARIEDLDPAVNPMESVVEQGGVAYRYYRVVDSGGQAAGSVQVEVRSQSGSVVPQIENRSHDWAGKVPGISDPDGIVRLMIPADSVGSHPGDSRRFDVVLEGRTWAAFSARIQERIYDHVWSHKVGGGVKGNIAILKVGGKLVCETEVRRPVAGKDADQETIQRVRQYEVRAGVGSEPGIKVGANATAGVEAGGFAATELQSTFGVAADSREASENILKLYLAWGDTAIQSVGMSLGPSFFGLINAAQAWIEKDYLEPYLQSVGGDLKIGRYGKAGVQLGFDGGNDDIRLGLTGKLSGKTAVLGGYERQYPPKVEEACSVSSVGYLIEGSAKALLGGKRTFEDVDVGIHFPLLDFSAKSEFRAQYAKSLMSGTALAARVVQTGFYEPGIPFSLPEWQGYVDPNLGNLVGRKLQDALSYDLTRPGARSQLNGVAALWYLLGRGLENATLDLEQPESLLAGLFKAATINGEPLDYTRSVQVEEQRPVELEVGLDALAAGLGVSLEGNMTKGVDAVHEQGRIWRARRMPLQSAGPLSKDKFPQRSLVDIERQWLEYATPEIARFVNQMVTKVVDTGKTIVEAGGALLEVGGDALEAGAEIVSQWLRPGAGTSQPHPAGIHAAGMSDDGFLPPQGSTNWIYGVSGIFRFESTNVLKNPVKLTLPYEDTDVKGLDEAQLRIFHLQNGGSQWQLIGGTVDTNANIVSVMVTNLGTFALAPPLPAGTVLLRPGGNSLPADGKTQMTIMVTNLLLNTGQPALEPWLFTVTTTGLELTEADVRVELPGTQIAATNSSLVFSVRAQPGSDAGQVSVMSVAGDAYGELSIPLVDDWPPNPPTNITASAGQSRIWIQWDPNAETDLSGYRVYYRLGQPGPPWDGTAAVGGAPSPILTGSSNIVLRGLAVSNVYYIAVAALDGFGNESSLSSFGPLTTVAGPPQPPTAVSVKSLTNDTTQITWTLSEDDAFNDADVVGYEIWRAVMPGGDWAKVGEVPSAVGLYYESTPVIETNRYARYAVMAVDRDGNRSDQALANRFMADVGLIDNDGDGMPDDWERLFGLNPNDPADANADADQDGNTNLEEYLNGTQPAEQAAFLFETIQRLPDGRFAATIAGPVGKTYKVEFSSDLMNWFGLTNFVSTNAITPITDDDAVNKQQRFYRSTSPTP